VKWSSVTSPSGLTVKFDVIRPCAPAKRPSPPVTRYITTPWLHPATGAGPTCPRPTVSKAIDPARP